MTQQMICPHCGHANSVMVSLCVSCGNPLQVFEVPQEEATAATAKPGKTVLMPRDDNDAVLHLHNRRAYFGRGMKLFLYVMETDVRIPCEFDGSVTIGREEADGEPHITLSAHNAAQLGVSRRHAKLIRSTATVMIEDLGTLNGTYLNGEKLTPGHTSVLCDGDELRFGKMLMAVVFER